MLTLLCSSNENGIFSVVAMRWCFPPVDHLTIGSIGIKPFGHLETHELDPLLPLLLDVSNYNFKSRPFQTNRKLVVDLGSNSGGIEISKGWNCKLQV